ncbi:MptD family putative ECF transporter S component [Slackia heliotrinireducens]|uniref:MptD family putative ECF transporter S component n=1 Tax=Slackia heliotrinireducens TaxID=84110 RepID=UPI003315524B
MDATRKLNGKDLINVGIYTALYFVCVFVVAMLGLIPVGLLLLVVLVPLIAAIPFVMYLAKVRKPGMLLITSVIMGVLMLLTGMGYYSLILSVITGLAAEFIWKSGGYTSIGKIAPTYAVFNLWMWGNYLPLFLNYDSYVAARPEYGDAYWQTLNTLLPPWMLIVLAACIVVFSILGALYAKKVLTKKLAAAGME